MASLMKVWPRPYKIVLVLTALTLVLAGVLYYFVLLPVIDRHEEASDELETQLSKIRKSEWDANEDAIQYATKIYTLALGDAKNPADRQKSEELLKQATGHLQGLIDKVKEESQNPSISVEGKKTYSDLYDDVKKKLLEHEIELAPDLFGMSRSSEGNYYNMSLKMLMTREITDLILRHKLTVARTVAEYLPEKDLLMAELRGQEGQKKIHPSDITAKPVVAYALSEGELPYLLKVSIRFTVIGNLENFAAFAANLQKEGRRYSLENLELQTEKPMLRGGRRAQLIWGQENDRQVAIRRIVATVVCSGYALPENNGTEGTLEELKKGLKKNKKGSEEAVVKPLGV